MEIKTQGLAEINHFDPISEDDLQKLYSSMLLNPNIDVKLLIHLHFDRLCGLVAKDEWKFQ